MHQFACVFLHVGPGDADGFLCPVDLNVYLAMLGNGQFKLGNLVALG